jgi:DNA primase
LIRKKGKEEFNKRVNEARDFFDYWIEKETATVDLTNLGAKMELARRLADTVSKVQDTLMRSEVSNKISARLSIPSAEFQKLIPKASRARFSNGESRQKEPTPAPRHDVAMLCLLALRDEGAREFLREQNWREVLGQTAGSELLVRILESEIRPSDSASLNVFMATLAPAEEAIVSSWLLQKMPPNARLVAEQWWMGLRQNALRRQLQVAEGRMKVPGLSTGDVVNLQKQILDLQGELRDLPQLSSASRIDN